MTKLITATEFAATEVPKSRQFCRLAQSVCFVLREFGVCQIPLPGMQIYLTPVMKFSEEVDAMWCIPSILENVEKLCKCVSKAWANFYGILSAGSQRQFQKHKIVAYTKLIEATQCSAKLFCEGITLLSAMVYFGVLSQACSPGHVLKVAKVCVNVYFVCYGALEAVLDLCMQQPGETEESPITSYLLQYAGVEESSALQESRSKRVKKLVALVMSIIGLSLCFMGGVAPLIWRAYIVNELALNSLKGGVQVLGLTKMLIEKVIGTETA